MSLDQLIPSCDLSSACFTSSALYLSVCVFSSPMTADPSASSFANFSEVSSSDCGLSSAVSSLDGGRYHRRRSLRDVLLWHELSRGTGPELCSPVKALVAALSGVAPQVLFLLEGSLSYHCACRLRLAESCIFFFFCFPSAARGYLLSPLSFSVFTRCVWSLALCPQSLFVVFHTLLLLPQSSSLRPQTVCGWDVVSSPCACSPVRGTGAATLRAPLTW